VPAGLDEFSVQRTTARGTSAKLRAKTVRNATLLLPLTESKICR
jgi:hypothetical protein